MSTFKRLRKDERRSEAERIEYWQKFHADLEAERKAASNRSASHRAAAWYGLMILGAACLAAGYVIGAVWGNV